MIKVSIVEEYEKFSYETIFPVLPNKGDSIGVSKIISSTKIKRMLWCLVSPVKRPTIKKLSGDLTNGML